jgi:hypothetical protein
MSLVVPLTFTSACKLCCRSRPLTGNTRRTIENQRRIVRHSTCTLFVFILYLLLTWCTAYYSCPNVQELSMNPIAYDRQDCVIETNHSICNSCSIEHQRFYSTSTITASTLMFMCLVRVYSNDSSLYGEKRRQRLSMSEEPSASDRRQRSDNERSTRHSFVITSQYREEQRPTNG